VKASTLGAILTISAAMVVLLGGLMQFSVSGNCIDLGESIACEEGWQFNLFQIGRVLLYAGSGAFVSALILWVIFQRRERKEAGAAK